MVTLDSSDNLILTTSGDGHVVAVSGLTGMVVVHTPTATLVTTRDGAEQVKLLVDSVETEAGPQFT